MFSRRRFLEVLGVAASSVAIPAEKAATMSAAPASIKNAAGMVVNDGVLPGAIEAPIPKPIQDMADWLANGQKKSANFSLDFLGRLHSPLAHLIAAGNQAFDKKPCITNSRSSYCIDMLFYEKNNLFKNLFNVESPLTNIPLRDVSPGNTKFFAEIIASSLYEQVLKPIADLAKKMGCSPDMTMGEFIEGPYKTLIADNLKEHLPAAIEKQLAEGDDYLYRNFCSKNVLSEAQLSELGRKKAFYEELRFEGKGANYIEPAKRRGLRKADYEKIADEYIRNIVSVSDLGAQPDVGVGRLVVIQMNGFEKIMVRPMRMALNRIDPDAKWEISIGTKSGFRDKVFVGINSFSAYEKLKKLTPTQ